ncbi:hypothetical protein [Gluconobacter cerinus]|uniref:hypothetical protein n=1 Tax=Gluconobacter cerinus TaxID=38307 RepID=UPI001B8D54E2|nr:hypothetical protein [Gluconobacter cerinus]MBS1045276.1 hypothetical protein [Gluconobacter cerinus]
MTPYEKGLLNLIVKGSTIIALSACTVAFLSGIRDGGQFSAMFAQIASWSGLWYCSRRTARISPQRIRIQLSVFAAAFSLIFVSSVAQMVLINHGYTAYLKYFSIFIESFITPMPELYVLIGIFGCVVLYRIVYALMAAVFGLYTRASIPYTTITTFLATLAAKGFSACAGGICAIAVVGNLSKLIQFPMRESIGIFLEGLSILGVPAFAQFSFDINEFIWTRIVSETRVFKSPVAFAVRNVKPTASQ